MKVLMSALACEPGRGSELEVGFRAMLAAARRHEVWVLTNADSIPSVAAAIVGTEEAARIHLEGIEFGLDEIAFSRLTAASFQWYYDRWQRRAGARALELERQIDFDVVHHVTLASYWTRAAAAIVDKPLVWGPVGGGVEIPWRLIRALGWRGLGEDLGRLIVRRALARLGPARISQQRASVILAQNKATARRLKDRDDIAILTNAISIDLDDVRPARPRTKDIYLVGRLVPWKAPILAVRAMRDVKDADCVLHICGDGPERRRIERAARRWGVWDRVSFDGWLPREVLLERLATAGALIHPALHEEAGLCVAEALAMGTPVVCLNWGGPPDILVEWPDTTAVAVEPIDAPSTARAMAAAVDDFLTDLPEVRQSPLAPRTSFQEELLEAYDRAVETGSVPRHRTRPVEQRFPLAGLRSSRIRRSRQ
jgi:glycosyltransferase involved in cell wall biosynthesis